MSPMEATEGSLAGQPTLSWGAGPPVVALPGLSARNANPRGMDRTIQTDGLQAVAERFTVHLLQRRPGLRPGTTVSDLAADVADAIGELGGGPVPVVGISTGGSVALQLAVDHPGLVSRLVVGCGAMRLSAAGRARQAALAELTRAGRPRAAWAQLAPALAGTLPGRAVMWPLLWLGGGPQGDDAGDLLATVAAEDAYDVGPRLGEVRAPTLVVVGGRDGFYGAQLAHDTARAIPDGHLLLYPRSSHMTTLGNRSAQRAIAHFLAGEEWR